MPDNTVNLEIDGKNYSTERGKMIIEIADEAGVNIPRFCYHKKLSVAANCRMCLVEVEKAPKELPACATPVTDGMKVWTRSKRALAAQKAVMEFLLINHPLDCPICDQGGECELQDVSMGYGDDVSRYSEGKRVVHDEDIGPLIATDMTRCIQCTRCVRFGDEVAGLRELGALGRGEHLEIGTYIGRSLVSELSGNVIDICPVGALTSKPYRFTARAWELKQFKSVAPHDALGSNVYIHVRRGQAMRAVPCENEAINETWLSDRDRFSYCGINHTERVLSPKIKVNGEWQDCDWQTAFEFAVNRLSKIYREQGGDQIAAIISPSATLEEMYLFQKVFRNVGCNNIDHRIRQIDTRDQHSAPLYPKLSLAIQEVENQDAIFLIGSSLQREVPLLNHRVRKAALKGAAVVNLNCVNHPTNYNTQRDFITHPDNLVYQLAQITKAALESTSVEITKEAKDCLARVEVDELARQTAQTFKQAEKKLILLGLVALHHPEAATIRALAQLLAKALHANYGEITEGANTAGAWIAGVVSHRAPVGQLNEKGIGLSAEQALQQALKAYVLFNVEPEVDSYNPAQSLTNLKQADTVVVISPFMSKAMHEYADVVLPIVPFTETDGTFVNMEGQWQTFNACIQPQGESRPGWKVLRVLGNLLELNGFEYQTAGEILNEVKVLHEKYHAQLFTSWFCPKAIEKIGEKNTLQRISEWAIYSGDVLVRRAEPLQQSATQEKAHAYVHPTLGESLKLSEGQKVKVQQEGCVGELTVAFDQAVPERTVLIYNGLQPSIALGAAFGEVEIYL